MIVVSNQERAMAAVVIAALVLGPRPVGAQPAPTVPQAIARLQNQDFSGAAEILEKVTTTEPENGRAWSLLGLAYRSLERPDEAITAYETAVSLPNSGDAALFNLGLTLLLNGREDRGFALLGEARALGAVELTQIDINPGVEAFRDNPRYMALFPTAEQFADPFVEPVRIIHEWRGESVNDQFGWIARDIGDVNADGHDDVLVGAPQNDAGGQDAGRVYIFSGATGAVLLTLTGEQTGDAFGSSAGGHVSEDGLVTIVVGAPNAGPGDRGAVYVYHGLTPDPPRSSSSPTTRARS